MHKNRKSLIISLISALILGAYWVLTIILEKHQEVVQPIIPFELGGVNSPDNMTRYVINIPFFPNWLTYFVFTVTIIGFVMGLILYFTHFLDKWILFFRQTIKNVLTFSSKHLGWIIIGFIIILFGIYHYWYVPYSDFKKGFVKVNGFDCPADHRIKAHLDSMIYHLPGDPYYKRTSAANGFCFDTEEHAQKQGFRNSYNR